jgi:hypothetical protein
MSLTPEQLEKALRLKDGQAIAQRVKVITDDLQTQIDDLDDGAIKSVKVNGTALTPTEGAVDVLIAVEKKATANTGYAASYTIKANGTALSPDIDIPKDFLVKSATLETVTTADVPYSGAQVGDKYIDFVINAKDASETAEHIYLPVNDLVDVYTAGNGLALDSNNQFSVTIDSSNANGLSVGANGVALAAVTASTSGEGGTNGAMLATDKEKLNGISTEANKVTVATESAGTIEIDGTSKTVVAFATDAEVTEMLNGALPAPAVTP